MAKFNAILRNTLQVKNANVLAKFYVEVLGMRILSSEVNSNMNKVLLGYNEELLVEQKSVSLELVEVANAQRRRDDGYWKIGITLPDVLAAVSLLREKGIQVSDPSQFRDIGFLCHLADPEGFTIELLQHTFENNFKSASLNSNYPLGYDKPVVGQVTLRICDPKQSLNFYRDLLGMKFLSRQQVDVYGFALYFLAFSNDFVAEENVDNVNIREWLYQRPYTTLELQHRYNKSGSYNIASENEYGWSGITISCYDVQQATDFLRQRNIRIDREPSLFQEFGKSVLRAVVLDPDGYRVSLIQTV